MAGSNWKIFAPNLICIGIDSSSKTEYSGRIWHQYADGPISFGSTIDMIWIMERLFDEWDFPQSAMVFRSFSETGRHEGRRKGRADLKMDAKRIQDKSGDRGTFIVRVKYRQNATWQGDVVWAEKNKRQDFRSAMELLHLINSAFEGGEDGEDGGDSGDEVSAFGR